MHPTTICKHVLFFVLNHRPTFNRKPPLARHTQLKPISSTLKTFIYIFLAIRRGTSYCIMQQLDNRVIKITRNYVSFSPSSTLFDCYPVSLTWRAAWENNLHVYMNFPVHNIRHANRRAQFFHTSRTSNGLKFDRILPFLTILHYFLHPEGTIPRYAN